MRRKVLKMVKQPNQLGLSLVELLIALALGLILTLGVTQIFLSTKQTSRLTDGLSTVQENIRFAIDYLQRNTRMAGHAGCLIGSPNNLLNTSSKNYDPNVYDGPPIMGWDAKGTGLGDTYTITTFVPATTPSVVNGAGDTVPTALAGKVVPGTDFFVVSGSEYIDTSIVSASGGKVVHNTTAGDLVQGAIVIIVAGDCSAADKFQKTDTSTTTVTMGVGSKPGNNGTNFTQTYDSSASLYVYKSTAYYIGVDNSSGTAVPALYSLRLDAAGSLSGATELVAGIENMQVLYGVQTGSKRIADKYVTAANVTDWSQVVSVRIALLTRNTDAVTDTAAAKTYNLLGTQITTQSDKYARLVGATTVGLRNMLE